MRAMGFSSAFAFGRYKESAAASTFASESFISMPAHSPFLSTIASTSRPNWSRGGSGAVFSLSSAVIGAKLRSKKPGVRFQEQGISC